ncbi:hypothetical protein DVS28_a2917 [Euzebya pacifica]|uniref:Uncharacterized protein n=1 Tax=Euzebya pacifica TaxID=1608957 RepID=A0A346XZE9_9ACTN|nr:hypothetical protein [Euzebya pacifica]AXV07596.1 hypothetical protein DVS28_a2917 [Euzebya pacifica]
MKRALLLWLTAVAVSLAATAAYRAVQSRSLCEALAEEIENVEQSLANEPGGREEELKQALRGLQTRFDLEGC